MKKYKFKKPALLLCYLFIFVMLLGMIFAVDIYFKDQPIIEDTDYNYVSKSIFEEDVPVINTDVTIIRPYTDTNVKVLKSFYDYKADENEQEKSILYYESTYMQNNSIAYGGVESFNVVSILDGKVIKVHNDELVGNVIEIEHDNNIISVYQSVSDVKVKVNDQIKQGDVIAKSGESNINKDLKSHLLFELVINNQISNSENYFDKKLNSIKE